MTEEKNSWRRGMGGSFAAAYNVKETLPAGHYYCFLTNEGINFEPLKVELDSLIIIKDSKTDLILEEVNKFWGARDLLKKYGFLHKRGILLAGPPGGGKTVTINLITQDIINNKNGIVMYMKDYPSTTARGIKLIRKIEPDRPIVCIIEDIDDVISKYGETDLLDLLDGGTQTENIIFVATTNHVEKLEDRIVKRPSRFDTVEYIYPPDATCRRKFLTLKDPEITEEELDLWVSKSEGLSYAHLKEIIIMNRCYGKDVVEVINNMKTSDVRKTAVEDANGNKNPIGFNTGGTSTMPVETAPTYIND